MGQCGCGDLFPVAAYKIDEGKYIVVSEYHGCDYCGGVIAHDIYFYDNKGMEDIADWVKPISVEFDEYGGKVENSYIGDGLPLFDIEDFREILEENKDHYGRIEDYGSIADWLDDFGLHLIQKAMIKIKEKRAAKSS